MSLAAAAAAAAAVMPHVTDLMFYMTLSSACMVFVKLTAEEVLLWYKPLKRDNNATLTFHAHEI